MSPRALAVAAIRKLYQRAISPMLGLLQVLRGLFSMPSWLSRSTECSRHTYGFVENNAL